MTTLVFGIFPYLPMSCLLHFYTYVQMWRAMHRVALGQGKQACRSLAVINTHSSRRYSLNCLRNGHRFCRLIGQNRWNSGVPVGAEPFLSGSSGSYVEAMYESWQKDRSSVHKVTSCYQTFVLYLLCCIMWRIELCKMWLSMVVEWSHKAVCFLI